MVRRSVIGSLIISVLFLLGPVRAWGQTVPEFTDVKGSFAEQSINNLAKHGMIQGIGSNQFGPALKISRIQYAILLARVLGVQPLLASQSSYIDLASGTLASGYVEALTRLGILQGSGGNSFKADEPIHRQDAALILQRALDDGQTLEAENYYKDGANISPYAAPGVAFVTRQELMNGSSGCFFPQHYLTRQEAAILAERLLKMRIGQAALDLTVGEEVLELESGEIRDILSAPNPYPAAFTETYGRDSQNISVINSASAQIKGLSSGTANLTRNRGTRSRLITVEVVETGAKAAAADSAEDDTTSEELALNYKVLVHNPDSSFQQTEYKGYSGPVEGLISKSDTWIGYFRQQGRDIIIDLGQFQPVSSIAMEFKQDSGAGIYYPQYMAASLSADGLSWYQLGQVQHRVELGDKKVQSMTLSLEFPSAATRYVKLSFPVDVFVFARHLAVKGSIPAEKPVILAPIISSESAQAGYLQTADFQDILLVFTGDQTAIKTIRSDDFLPLVAYLSPAGTVQGRMFDTIQFMPYTGIPCTRASWNSYLNDLFTPGQQLNALEDTMSKLGWTEKEKVILTLPYPDSNQTDFDDLEKTGQVLSFASYDQQSAKNRLAVVQWYYNELMQRWNSAGFKHLELAGIYWYQETMDPKVKGEAELVQKVAQMVKAQGQNFIWIPYYGAQGLAEWKSYGFTHAFLQPNYYATPAPTEERMDQAAGLARQYQTGIELECDNRVLTTRYYYDLFYKELSKAQELGLDGNTPNAYYVGFAQTLLDMVDSEIPPIRKIYDDLYLWINGRYK